MRLEVEIKQERGRKASVLDCARKGVAIIRFLLDRRWIESAVVSLPANDDGDLRLILQAPSGLPERLLDFRIELLFEYLVVLALSQHINRLISL